MGPYKYSEVVWRGCGHSKWSSEVFYKLEIDYTPLNLGLVMGNKRLIEQLLWPVLSHPAQAPVHVVKHVLIISCLAGDADTASKILAHYPNLSILAIDQWALGVTPLVATAWNKDVTIAELLMGLSAYVGPKPGDGILQPPAPAPIHVAAYHGNTNLVRHLIDRGADCNVLFVPPPPPDSIAMEISPELADHLSWLLPVATASPLQLALLSCSGDTATVLISQRANTLGVKSAQAVDLGDSVPIPDLVLQGASALSAYQNIREVLEVNVETGNAVSIMQLYFSLGGLYRSEDFYVAVEAAIKTKDYSIVRLLADCRPIGEIDSYEASAFVISIEEREWNLISLLLCDSFLPGPSKSYYYQDILGGLSYSPPYYNPSYPNHSGRGVAPLDWAIHSAIDSVVEEMVRRGYKLQDSDRYHLESKDLLCHQRLLLDSMKSCDVQKVQKHIKLVDSLDFKAAVQGTFGVMRFSPLGFAAYLRDAELVHLMLDAGAGIDFQAWHKGRTALQIAADDGHLDVANILLDRGAMMEPLERLVKGATALQYSAIRGHLSMAKMLISRGANINALPAKHHGRTALEGAAENGRLDMVQFLLKMGAELEGEMRIYYVRSVGFARKHGHLAIANLLKEYGSWGERDQSLSNRPNILQDSTDYDASNGATVDYLVRDQGGMIREGEPTDLR